MLNHSMESRLHDHSYWIACDSSKYNVFFVCFFYSLLFMKGSSDSTLIMVSSFTLVIFNVII